ncbi:MAG: PP2C family protein-serine/threonine phosphatase [Acidobacteria bacterium]|nr:PP2C family protein-serine/threonine phosphatase [Acidobacteriota bacterium]
MRLPTPARLFWIATAAIASLSLVAHGLVDSPWLRIALEVLLASVVTLASVVLIARGLRWFLWRVGRRLAFSYFLIGVLPIPMVMVLGGIGLYLLSGYFLGHEYRAALDGLHHDLQSSADNALAHFAERGTTSPITTGHIALAFYASGRRVAGDADAPRLWPDWVAQHPTEPDSSAATPFWTLPDSSLTVVATASSQTRGVLAFYRGSLAAELSRRSAVWVTLTDPSDRDSTSPIRLQLLSGEYALANISTGTDVAARNAFFGIENEDPPWSARPLLWWGEVAGPLHSLEDGSEVSAWSSTSLNSNLRSLQRQFFSSSAELNAAVWASLIAVTGLLSSLYFVAVVMALFMTYTLSRAVNHLSRATDAVLLGEFSRRIPVHRHDQIGELQHSFNDMTGNLESLIETAAQKESLEKELEIARDLQESLLPVEVPATERVEFSTLFEPSAAIGGDYFDILRIDEDRLAVVVADVSGHGLPTGLRMAMLKAALVILVEEKKPASEILHRLNRMVRAEKRRRFFVTATIAVIDFRRDTLEITNAGHPPTYLVRGGEVEEILLAGSPLGVLDENYQQRVLELKAGDVAVWLSDGLIEANNGADEPFGYEATAQALRGPARSAQEVRDRLLAAIELHSGGEPAEDDRTLVAMHYFPGAAADANVKPRNE